MSIVAKTLRPILLASGSLCVLMAAQAVLAAGYGSYTEASPHDYTEASPHDAVARRLDPPPSARQLAREGEFERRGGQGAGRQAFGQQSTRRVDRNVQRAAFYETDSTRKRGESYGPVPREVSSRERGSSWSPDRKRAPRRPSYFDGLYRRREAQRYDTLDDFESEYDEAEGYGPRRANFQEELPPGRDPRYEAHPVYESDGFEGQGPHQDEYYGGEEFYGPGGWEERPYGGYSEGGRPRYFIPPGNWRWWDDFTIFGGVHAFKGPLDQGRNGNFGFHEGLNWGGPLWDYMQIGYQVGAQVFHSNFHGDQVYTPTDDGRTQYFVTTGLFHRADGCGIQAGIVVDWLQDDYYGQINLTQIRAEVSYVMKSQNEFGVWAATNTDEADISPEVLAVSNSPESLRSADMFTAFWRKQFGQRGEGRLWAGSSSGGNVVFGGNIRVPLSKQFAIESNFNYLSADGEEGRHDNTAESWSTVFNLVWYPGWTACKSGKHVYRPLFNVADNSTFMIEPNQTDGDRWVLDNVVDD